MDREKVIKGLEHCLSIYIDGLCDGCPYFGELDQPYMIILQCKEILMRDAIALLKEQNNCENCAIAIEDRQPVVRCKDCRYYLGINEGCGARDFYPPSGDWFCADGERR